MTDNTFDAIANEQGRPVSRAGLEDTPRVDTVRTPANEGSEALETTSRLNQAMYYQYLPTLGEGGCSHWNGE